MSTINVDTIRDRAGTRAPQLDKGGEVTVGVGITGDGGVQVGGACTAGAGFVGDLTGDVTGNVTGNCSGTSGSATGTAGGLTGTPDITVNNITGVAATFTGVLTYEDVTSVDSTGIVTARGGVNVGSPTGVGATILPAGGAVFAGVSTASSFHGPLQVAAGATVTGSSNIITFETNGSEVARYTATAGISLNNGLLAERFYTNTTAWSTNGDLNLDNGMVQYNSSNLAGTNNTLNVLSSVGINTELADGDVIAVTAITACNSTSSYVNRISIDGLLTGITTSWVGGSEPSDGGGSAVDIYAFNILKTGSATYIVVANHSKTS